MMTKPTKQSKTSQMNLKSKVKKQKDRHEWLLKEIKRKLKLTTEYNLNTCPICFGKYDDHTMRFV
jgi:hypothetical protein